MAKPRPRVIALEEHYWDPEVAAMLGGSDAGRQPPLAQRYPMEGDALDARLKDMDEAGIDVQVISLGAPGFQRTDAETAVRLARLANDRLHESIQSHRDRFAAFAALPTPDPGAAADELERTVSQLGFKGAMIHGLTNGVFFDDKRFWPIYERAQALDVPLYLHPAAPHPAVVDAYYQDYVEAYPGILTAGWAYTVETATQGLRVVLSGVLDAYPRIKLILGHLGESLPFSLWRTNYALSRDPARPDFFRDLFCEHFYITTSGHFSTPALLCSILEMGVDRILFSVDYPFNPNEHGMKWMDELQISPDDRAKILGGNASRLLRV